MRTVSHFLRFLAGVDAPLSQVTERERALLREYARRASTVVELGCYEGLTSVSLAAVTDGEVYAVDHFSRGRLGICYTEWIAKIHRRRSHAKNLTYVKGDTHAVAKDFHSKIDMLFIDADHSYEGVKGDWEAWIPKLEPGGVAALHDCRQADNSPNRLGSMKFYEEVLKNDPAIEEIAGVDCLAVFQIKQ